jgi:hypothetical protein
MSNLTLEEKSNSAAQTASEKTAEKHFFELYQPFFPLGFSVYYRNPGHWDISARQCPGKYSAWRAANPSGSTSGQDGESERAFRIRGEPGKVVVYDERWDPTRTDRGDDLKFHSVMGAMLWIMEELMQEPNDAQAS